MSDNEKEQAKVEKKLAKSLVKEEKARAKANQAIAPGPAPAPSSSPTPAERSAAAAERQVKLQSYRVWFAALGVIIAIATLLVTLKPWQ